MPPAFVAEARTCQKLGTLENAGLPDGCFGVMLREAMWKLSALSSAVEFTQQVAQWIPERPPCLLDACDMQQLHHALMKYQHRDGADDKAQQGAFDR